MATKTAGKVIFLDLNCDDSRKVETSLTSRDVVRAGISQAGDLLKQGGISIVSIESPLPVDLVNYLYLLAKEHNPGVIFAHI